MSHNRISIDQDKLLRLHRSGHTIGAIASEFGCSRDTIISRLKKIGEPSHRTGPVRKYTFDEKYFDEIDTADKAYWLGFVFADGHVATHLGTRPCGLRIDLGYEDGDHLTKFLRSVGDDRTELKVCVRRNKRTGKRTRSRYIILSSAYMARSLMRLGCLPRKTWHPFVRPQLPESLVSHFYRGYFDGDGWLTGELERSLGVIGHESFLQEFEAQLNTLGVNVSFWRRRKVTCDAVVSGNKQVANVLRWLYANATTYLDRKYSRYRRFMASRISRGHLVF